MKVCRRIGGMHSDMPSAPVRLSWVVMRLPAGRMQVYYETAARRMEAGQKTKKG